MSMTCIKTGAHVRLTEYQQWVRGDVYLLPMTPQRQSILVMRIVSESFEPVVRVKHFTIDGIDNWFDQHDSSPTRLSTLITKPGMWRQHPDGTEANARRSEL